MPLARKHFLALTKLSQDAVNVMKHRDLISLKRSAPREYSLYDAFLAIIMQGFSGEPDGLATSNARARAIIEGIDPKLEYRMEELAEQVAPSSAPQVFAGRLTKQFPVGTTYFVGTAAELMEEYAGAVPVVDVELVNVSLVLQTLALRCAREGIDISELFVK